MATRDRKPAAERRNRQVFEERRLHAADLFEQGIHQAEVARRLGVSRQTVSRWRDHGTEGLRSLGPPGRAPKLSVAQLDLVERALLRGAKAHGFDTEPWTLGRIAEVIWRTTGVRHHPAQVWRLLRHRMGWSLQRPARRASERDEEAIRQWVAVDWPRIKKRQTPQGRHRLLRRVGHLADPERALDLGAQGPPPVICHHFNWKRVSMAAGLC